MADEKIHVYSNEVFETLDEMCTWGDEHDPFNAASNSSLAYGPTPFVDNVDGKTKFFIIVCTLEDKPQA